MEVKEELECYLQILKQNVEENSEEMNKKLVSLVKMMESFCIVYEDFQKSCRKLEILKNKMGIRDEEEGEDEEE